MHNDIHPEFTMMKTHQIMLEASADKSAMYQSISRCSWSVIPGGQVWRAGRQQRTIPRSARRRPRGVPLDLGSLVALKRVPGHSRLLRLWLCEGCRAPEPSVSLLMVYLFSDIVWYFFHKRMSQAPGHDLWPQASLDTLSLTDAYNHSRMSQLQVIFLWCLPSADPFLLMMAYFINICDSTSQLQVIFLWCLPSADPFPLMMAYFITICDSTWHTFMINDIILSYSIAYAYVALWRPPAKTGC